MTAPRTGSDRLLELAWLAVAGLVPLAFNPWASNPFELHKAALLRTLVWTMLAIWIVGYILAPRRARGRPVTTPATLPAAVLLAVMAAATLFAVDPTLSFWGGYQRSQGLMTLVCFPLLMLLVADRLPGAPGAKRLFWVLALTVVPLGAYVAFQIAGPDPFGLVSDSRSPLFATLGRSNFLAAHVAVLMPLTLALLLSAEKKATQAAAGALWLLELVLLVVTRARASLLAAAAALAIFLVLTFRRRLATLARTAAVQTAVVLAAAGALAGGAWLAQAGGSGAARLAIWQATQRLIVARPLLGYGPDALELVFPRVFPPELVYYQGRGLGVDRAHNVVLDWTVTLGFLGLLAGLWVLAAVVLAGVRSLERDGADEKTDLLVVGALSAILGNVVGTLVSFDVVSTSSSTWLVAGAVLALARSDAAHSAASAPAERSPGAPAIRAAAAVAVLLVLAVAVVFCNVRPVLADVMARQANRHAARQEWGAGLAAAQRAVEIFPIEPAHAQYLSWLHLQVTLAGGDDPAEHLTTAERLLAEAIARRPGDFRLQAALAEFHGEVALRVDRRHLDRADAAWAAAARLAPNYGLAYRAWGTLWLQAGNPERAIPLLRKAVDLDASDTEAWRLLADIELARGQAATALVLYRKAGALAPNRADIQLGLARTYWALGQPDAALAAIEDILRLDQDNDEARVLRRELHAVLEKNREGGDTRTSPDVDPTE